MNKDNAKDYLPLVQALAEGKVIQYFPDEWEGWIDCDDVNFCIDASKFRIKPEPRIIYVLMFGDGKDRFSSSFDERQMIQWAAKPKPPGRMRWHDGIIRKFVEVIED